MQLRIVFSLGMLAASSLTSALPFILAPPPIALRAMIRLLPATSQPEFELLTLVILFLFG